MLGPRMCRPHLSVIAEEFDPARVTPASEAGQHWLPAPPPILTSDLLGEFDALGVSQRFGLFVNILDIQHLAHELYHRLSTVESRR